MIIQANLNICFTLKINLICTHSNRSPALIFDTWKFFAPRFNLLKQSCGNHLCFLVSGTFQDPLFLFFLFFFVLPSALYRAIIMLFQTRQDSHNAGSIGKQLQKKKQKKILLLCCKRSTFIFPIMSW